LYPASYKAQRAVQQPRSNLRLVPLHAHSASKSQLESDSSFGRRRSASSKRKPLVEASDEHVVHKADGTVEMSWVPTSRAKDRTSSDVMEDGDGDQRKREKMKTKRREARDGIERFGMGMSRGGEESTRSQTLNEEERSGRKTRRKGMRSGSKNTFRGL
jgi:ribosome biogenesis protein ENP2